MDISQEAREPSCRTPNSVCTPGNCTPKTVPHTPKTVHGNNAHTPKASLGNQVHTPKSTTGGNNGPHTPMSERQQLALIRHMEEEGRGEFHFLEFSPHYRCTLNNFCQQRLYWLLKSKNSTLADLYLLYPPSWQWQHIFGHIQPQTPWISMDPAPPPPLQRVATPSSPGFRFKAKWFAIRAPDILKSEQLSEVGMVE